MKQSDTGTVDRRAHGWWVESHVDGCDDQGPYDTKREATDALRDFNRFVIKEMDRSP